MRCGGARRVSASRIDGDGEICGAQFRIMLSLDVRAGWQSLPGILRWDPGSEDFSATE